MKALTIKEPWATLIIDGYKKYEFRSWKTNYRGKILIHAGMSEEKDMLKKFKDYNLNCSKGMIIGEALLTDCILVTKEFEEELLKIDKNLTNNKHIIQRCAILKLDCSCIYYNLRGKFRKYKKVIFRSRCMEE